MIPFLEIKKGFLVSGFLVQKGFMFSRDILYILPNSHFMFVDGYEIHIQAFLDFINGFFCHLPILISTRLYLKYVLTFPQTNEQT